MAESNKRPRSPSGVYRIRVYKGKNQLSHTIGVPNEIGLVLGPLGLAYKPELTDGGILYRPVTEDVLTEASLPEWAKRKKGK